MNEWTVGVDTPLCAGGARQHVFFVKALSGAGRYWCLTWHDVNEMP